MDTEAVLLKEFNLQINPDELSDNVKAVKVKVLHVCSAYSQLVMDVPLLYLIMIKY